LPRDADQLRRPKIDKAAYGRKSVAAGARAHDAELLRDCEDRIRQRQIKNRAANLELGNIGQRRLRQRLEGRLGVGAAHGGHASGIALPGRWAEHAASAPETCSAIPPTAASITWQAAPA